MKKFTIKDFIAYNNPCLNCNESISLTFSGSGYRDITESSPISIFSLRPFVSSKYTEVNLSVTYNNLLKVIIDHKTNSFSSNNIEALKSYMELHRIYLFSSCNKCGTNITSKYLEFDFDKNLINATEIETENIIVIDGSVSYNLYSDFIDNETILSVLNDSSDFRIKLSLLPKYKFKNKQHFIDKIKTYLTFS